MKISPLGLYCDEELVFLWAFNQSLAFVSVFLGCEMQCKVECCYLDELKYSYEKRLGGLFNVRVNYVSPKIHITLFISTKLDGTLSIPCAYFVLSQIFTKIPLSTPMWHNTNYVDFKYSYNVQQETRRFDDHILSSLKCGLWKVGSTPNICHLVKDDQGKESVRKKGLPFTLVQIKITSLIFMLLLFGLLLI